MKGRIPKNIDLKRVKKLLDEGNIVREIGEKIGVNYRTIVTRIRRDFDMTVTEFKESDFIKDFKCLSSSEEEEILKKIETVKELERIFLEYSNEKGTVGYAIANFDCALIKILKDLRIYLCILRGE